ncbi:hypothetical protein AB6A40_006023 [Gnathostoma spinigerum]|uniref:TRAF3-interacting protein 1 n=1 Tax=Gnathostoma spinigerum TaxID=75299 RepID=A0ABD6EMD7_9BILA
MNTEKTRELFANVISRPPLTDHLLQKPPFKFIHDIVNSTIQNTGFPKELFSANELNSAYITDKASKVAFLQKLVDRLNDDGSLNDVKVAKIVAGKEPELTNKMLQKLAINATKYREEKARKSNGNVMQNESVVKKKKAKSEERTERKSRHKEKLEGNENKQRSLSRHSNKKVVKEKSRTKERRDSVNKDVQKSSKSKTEEQSPAVVRPTSKATVQLDSNETATGSNFEKTEVVPPAEDEHSSTAKTQDSGIADDLSIENDSPRARPLMPQLPRVPTACGRPQTSMGRPGTSIARPAPPKMKKKLITDTESKVLPACETSGLILRERQQDEEENYVVETDPEEVTVEHVTTDELQSVEHGVLVNTMIEKKRELEAAMNDDFEQQQSQRIYVVDDRLSKQSLSALLQSIQQLTQFAIPLTRFYESAPENIEGIESELESWRKENKRNAEAEREERNNNAAERERLLLSLRDLENKTRETRTLIAQCKANIFRYECTIAEYIHNLPQQ